MNISLDIKPIESAPKDGRPVLLFGGSYYCEEAKETIKSCAVARWFENTTWLIVGVDGGYIWIMYDEPTHWCEAPKL